MKRKPKTAPPCALCGKRRCRHTRGPLNLHDSTVSARELDGALYATDGSGATRCVDPSRNPPSATLDAATVARLRRKARRVAAFMDALDYEETRAALALANDLLRVLDGKPGRKR